MIKAILLLAGFTVFILSCKEEGHTTQNNVQDNIEQAVQEKQKQLAPNNDSVVLSHLCISTIKTSKEKVFIDDPIFISYSIKNISKDTINIWHSDYFDQNNKIVVTNDNNIEISRTGWGDTALLLFSPSGPREVNFPVSLAPDGTDSIYEKINLKDYFPFKKTGVYNVSYLYHEIYEKDIKIRSNTLKIEIVSRHKTTANKSIAASGADTAQHQQ